MGHPHIEAIYSLSGTPHSDPFYRVFGTPRPGTRYAGGEGEGGFTPPSWTNYVKIMQFFLAETDFTSLIRTPLCKII